MLQSLAKFKAPFETAGCCLALLGVWAAYGWHVALVGICGGAIWMVGSKLLDYWGAHEQQRAIRHLTCQRCGIKIFTDQPLGRCPHCGARS